MSLVRNDLIPRTFQVFVETLTLATEEENLRKDSETGNSRRKEIFRLGQLASEVVEELVDLIGYLRMVKMIMEHSPAGSYCIQSYVHERTAWQVKCPVDRLTRTCSNVMNIAKTRGRCCDSHLNKKWGS